MRGALKSKSRQQLERCLAAAVWAARHHSNIHHSLSPLAAWKPYQCTSAWRHRLKPTCRNMFIRNQWATSMSWSSIWLIRGQLSASAGKCCDEAETAHTECGHEGVVRGQLQKTEAPDRLTGIASLTEDQSDASTWRLLGNYSRGLCLHIPDCRLSSDGRNRGLPARP